MGRIGGSPLPDFGGVHSKASSSDFKIRCVARFETDGDSAI